MTLDDILNGYNEGDQGLLIELNPYTFQNPLHCDIEMVTQAMIEAAVREIYAQIISDDPNSP